MLFSELGLSAELLRAIKEEGYQEATPIQQQAIPHILEGRDILAGAQTGTGKTAGFTLPLLQRLQTLDPTGRQNRVRALILVPTRELAAQVGESVRNYGRYLPFRSCVIFGGVNINPQISKLRKGVDIVVATPGRLLDHMQRGTIRLEGVDTLVLDEADRMLDMGFQATLDAIIERVPVPRQTLLFSATYPDEIQSIARRVMIEPVLVQVASTHDNATIRQHFYSIDNDEQRMTALRLLLMKYRPQSALVFCKTRRETQEVADELRRFRVSTRALHGDLEQRDRDKTLVRFANKSASVLVATDVAARGLDIDALDAVINYHLAQDPELHLHRIGRTGRAGSKGVAYTLFSEKERYRIALLEERFEISIKGEALPPDYLLAKPAYKPAMATLLISGGKKQKVRPGDILGALTGEHGIAGTEVGKIDIFDNHAYVAVRRDVAKAALKKLTEGKLKGRSFRVRRL